MLALVLAALVGTAPLPPDSAAVPRAVVADSLRRPAVLQPPVRVYPRLAPSALYSPNRGFGIGGGIGVENLFGNGTQLTADVRLQQRAQAAALSFYTGDPFDAPVYGFGSAEASTTQRRRYYGLGPFSDGNDELFLNHNEAQIEARLGVYPLGTSALLIQPGVRFLYDHLLGVDDRSPNSIDQAFATPGEAASRTAVESAIGQDRYGLSVGAEVGSDLRDWRAYPRRGTFGSVEVRRFFALDGSDLAYNRVAVSTIGYLPVRGRTTIIGRLNVVLTRGNDADGDGTEDPIPFYYLPTLDDRLAVAFQQDRLIGRDVAVGALGVRLPLVDFLGAYGIDGLVMGFLGNVYDSLPDQFSPAVSFNVETRPGDGGRAPLRPAVGLGLGLVNLDKERVVLGGLIGVGAGGVTLATLRIAYDLRDARPLFR